MTQPTSDLSFERAAFPTKDDAGERCKNCNGAVGDEYFTWQQRIICAACRDRVTAILTKSKSGAAFGRAALLGGGTAFGCGLLYAIFVHITNYQLALATIGIAFVIAKVVRKASAGVGGRRFQVLAVALTYGAACMGYAPGLIKGVQKSMAEHAQTAAAEGSAATPSTAGAATAKGEPAASKEGGGGMAIVKFFGIMLGILLAAPFLEFTDAPLGLLIIAFGLWEAWKLSRGVSLTVDGPYRVRSSPSAG